MLQLLDDGRLTDGEGPDGGLPEHRGHHDVEPRQPVPGQSPRCGRGQSDRERTRSPRGRAPAGDGRAAGAFPARVPQPDRRDDRLPSAQPDAPGVDRRHPGAALAQAARGSQDPRRADAGLAFTAGRRGLRPGVRRAAAEAHDSAPGARSAGSQGARGRVPRRRSDRSSTPTPERSSSARPPCRSLSDVWPPLSPLAIANRETGGPLSSQRPAFSIWYVLGLLLLLALAQAWFLTPAGRQIPYSEFKTLVRSGQVVEATVGDQTINGKLREPQGEGRQRSDLFVTTRIEDPKLVEDLEAHQVKYTGETVSRWLPEILGWIIPLVLLIAVWSFFFRRIGGAEGGVMSFARSRAKIYADDDVKVSFAGRGRRGRGRGRASRDRRVPEEPEEVHDARRAHPEGRAAGGPAGNRQDAAGARRRRRSEGPVLLAERVGVRRDVRRRRRRARPRSLRAGRSRNRRASCSSTSSTRWARSACRARWAVTKSASRR